MQSSGHRDFETLATESGIGFHIRFIILSDSRSHRTRCETGSTEWIMVIKTNDLGHQRLKKTNMTYNFCPLGSRPCKSERERGSRFGG